MFTTMRQAPQHEPSTGPSAGVRQKLRRGALAAAAALTAAALLAGCGGGDSGDSGDKASPRDGGAQERIDASEHHPPGSGGAPGLEESPARQEDGSVSDTESVADLKPPNGEFTKKEEAYLTDEVPKGADPVAILEEGREACDRIGYLARHDRAAALKALRDGEIPEAEKAVDTLCPEHADLLAEALEETS